MKALNSFFALTVTILFTGGIVVNDYVSLNSGSIIENIHSGQAYSSEIATTNAPSRDKNI